VVILPLLADDRVCLIRNHRIAVGQTLVELPAGTREFNEPVEATALRELSEETGYVAGRLEPLCRFYPSPGILDEEMQLFAATELVSAAPRREPGERIENLVVQYDEALRMVGDGTIRDAKTICGLLWWERRRAALRADQ
jgi:ADP-ribose pyrophosphatase